MTSIENNVNVGDSIDNNIVPDFNSDCMPNVLKDRDGTYSVRKFGGYSAIVLTIYLIVSYTVAHGFKEEIPVSYVAIIGGIITFYFAKDSLRNIGNKPAGSDVNSGQTEWCNVIPFNAQSCQTLGINLSRVFYWDISDAKISYF